MRHWLLFTCLLLGCQSRPPAPSTSTPISTPVAGPAVSKPLDQPALPPFNPLFVQAALSDSTAVSETTASHAYGSGVCDLLSREEWDQLEAHIAAQRKSLEAFPSGIRKLTNIYFSLEASNGFTAGSNHLLHLRRLALWLRARPRSAAAHASLGRAVQVFAEGKLQVPSREQRGTFPQDFPEVDALLDQPDDSVFKLFTQARTLAPEDPEIWALTIKAARLLHAPDQQARAWMEEACRRFPTYPAVIGQSLQWELARDPGFAWWEMKTPPEILGLAGVYSNFKMNAELYGHLEPFLQQAVEKHPDSLYLRSKLANYASIANRLGVADGQYKVINYNWEAMAGLAAPLFFNYYQVHGIAPESRSRPPVALDGLLRKPDPLLANLLLYWQVEALLPGRRFAELDAIGAELRKQKQILADGTTRLEGWYSILNADLLKHRPQQEQEQLLRDWLKVNPQSYDARVGLILILQEKASDVRGGGWASEVSDKQWEQFHELHGEAWKLFQEIKDPDALTLTQGISLCRNLPEGKKAAYQLLARAVRQDPHLLQPYHEMAMLLLPRWGGDPGELQKFLKQSEKSFGPGLDGPIGLSLSQLSDVAEEEHFSDARLLASLEKLARSQPTVTYRNLFAATAFQKRNRAAAARAFALLGKDWDRRVFMDSLQLAKCRNWARDARLPYPQI